MMKANPGRLFLAATAVCGLLFASVQPAAAFELLARRAGEGASQKCDACQKGGDACQKGATQKMVIEASYSDEGGDACQKGATQKGACQKGGDACQKGACQKGGCDQGACQKGASQKGGCDKGACQKDACQKGGCDKGACQKAPHQRSWGAHQKGAAQKGGKGKDGYVGAYGENVGNLPFAGAPVPAPIYLSRGA